MTPFDGALRVQQRAVDAISVEIRISLETCDALSARQRDNAERQRSERALDAVWDAATDAWHARMRSQAVSLNTQIDSAEAELAQLREAAAERYGKLQLLEGAAERHRDEAARTREAATQAAIDDIAAIAFLRARRAKR